jgi:hypothetical protein
MSGRAGRFPGFLSVSGRYGLLRVGRSRLSALGGARSLSLVEPVGALAPNAGAVCEVGVPKARAKFSRAFRRCGSPIASSASISSGNRRSWVWHQSANTWRSSSWPRCESWWSALSSPRNAQNRPLRSVPQRSSSSRQLLQRWLTQVPVGLEDALHGLSHRRWRLGWGQLDLSHRRWPYRSVDGWVLWKSARGRSSPSEQRRLHPTSCTADLRRALRGETRMATEKDGSFPGRVLDRSQHSTPGPPSCTSRSPINGWWNRLGN